MQLLQLVLTLSVAVLASAVIAQLLPRVSAPLVQIGLGLALALIVGPGLAFNIESELFLAIFIAPLLFNESQSVDRRRLARQLPSVLSLAIGLVVAATFAVGFTLHLIVPSIPLAAALALGAALGPTDAAAVSSMSTSVDLGERQESLLAGEALFNDASGVVSFQFAVAAATTGAFSITDAGGSFALSFVGGVLAGAALALVYGLMHRMVRATGLESTPFSVVSELLLPVLVFLVAEELHVSGILAVVAAGIVTTLSPRLFTVAEARTVLVTGSVWGTLTFMLNGIVFVVLGLQLPAVLVGGAATMELGSLMLVSLAATAAVVGARFAWLYVMERAARRPRGGRAGAGAATELAPAADPEFERTAALDALILTLSGPKGAVTLSIALTLPTGMAGGGAFPFHDELIFIASVVIILTLLMANFIVPLLAPKSAAEEERELNAARRAAAEHVVETLEQRISDTDDPNEAFALSFVARTYLTGIRDLNASLNPRSSGALERLKADLDTAQASYLEELAADGAWAAETVDACRRALGEGAAACMNGKRAGGLKGIGAVARGALKRRGGAPGVCTLGVPEGHQEEFAELYAAVFKRGSDFLQGIVDSADPASEEGAAAIQAAQYLLGLRRSLKMGMKAKAKRTAALATRDEFTKRRDLVGTGDLRERIGAIEADALAIMLDGITELFELGSISPEQAATLRQGVYTSQLALLQS
ncbi:MAG: sodium:proton antiporter [Collinsella sp.]|nr:sodium:proton antiporter [Collinsella sp.]